MNRFVQDAQKLLKTVTNILPFPISLTDIDGEIIADSAFNRVGSIHAPSKEVLRKNDFVIFEEKDIANEANVLPGVAVPLKFDNETRGVLGIIGPPNEVMPHAKLIKQYVELMWQEMFLKQMADLEEKTLESFLQYILLNQSVDPLRVNQYCNRLNMNQRKKYFCVVIDLNGSLMSKVSQEHNSYSLTHLKETLLMHARETFIQETDDRCAYLNTEKMIVIKSVHSRIEDEDAMSQYRHMAQAFLNVCHDLKISWPLISAGTICGSLIQLNASYQKAEEMLSFAKKQRLNLQILDYYSWPILLKMLPGQINSTYIMILKKRLDKLFKYDSFQELKRDFMMYCDQNMNLTKAAKKLYIHRNTLIYRLNKIEQLTELDTRNFQHCLLLYAALKKFNHLPEKVNK